MVRVSRFDSLRDLGTQLFDGAALGFGLQAAPACTLRRSRGAPDSWGVADTIDQILQACQRFHPVLRLTATGLRLDDDHPRGPDPTITKGKQAFTDGLGQ